MNFLTSALPRFIMESFYGSRGSLIATEFIDPMSMKIDVPILRSIPVISDIFNNQTPLTYFSFVCVVLLTVVLYKTKFGIYVRVTGENGEAAAAIGIKTDRIKLLALIISAVTCGLAGLN
ncbi:MAG: ABC transporter permease, partial [Clostridia bacterium]